MYDMFSKPQVTGSLYFREVTSPKALPKGKKMMVVCGVIAVDEDFVIESEAQVQVRAQDDGTIVTMELQRSGITHTKYLGWTIEDVIREPIWRV